MDSSSENDFDQENLSSRELKGRTIQKTFVVVDENLKCVPRGSAWKRLENNGRVRELGINLRWTEEMLFHQLQALFPCLKEIKREQIRVYRSTSRGSSFERVANSLPCGKEIINLCKGSKSKRIFLNIRQEAGQVSKTKSGLVSSKNDSPSGSPNPSPSSQCTAVARTPVTRVSKNTSVSPSRRVSPSTTSKKSLIRNYHVDLESTGEDNELYGSDACFSDGSDNDGSSSKNQEMQNVSSSSKKKTYSGKGLVVGKLLHDDEENQLLYMFEEEAGTQQMLHSVHGLYFLPDSVEEAQQQAVGLGRPIIFIIAAAGDVQASIFLRNLNSLLNKGTLKPEEIPLLVLAKPGTQKSREILQRFSRKGAAKVIFCCPCDMSLKVMRITTRFDSGILKEFLKELKEPLKVFRTKKQRRKRQSLKINQDPHFLPDTSETEVVFRDASNTMYDKGDESTVIILEDDNEAEADMKREMQERENRERQERENRERKEREDREREERENRERQERESREMQEREDRERQERERRERQEREDRERQERENRERQEREDRERQERENRERKARRRAKRRQRERETKKMRFF